MLPVGEHGLTQVPPVPHVVLLVHGIPGLVPPLQIFTDDEAVGKLADKRDGQLASLRPASPAMQRPMPSQSLPSVPVAHSLTQVPPVPHTELTEHGLPANAALPVHVRMKEHAWPFLAPPKQAAPVNP